MVNDDKCTWFHTAPVVVSLQNSNQLQLHTHFEAFFGPRFFLALVDSMESLQADVMEVERLETMVQWRREILLDNGCLKAMLQVANAQGDDLPGHEGNSMLQEAKNTFTHVVLKGVAQSITSDVLEFFQCSNASKVICQQQHCLSFAFWTFAHDSFNLTPIACSFRLWLPFF